MASVDCIDGLLVLIPLTGSKEGEWLRRVYSVEKLLSGSRPKILMALSPRARDSRGRCLESKMAPTGCEFVVAGLDGGSRSAVKLEMEFFDRIDSMA
jgi:hypothetical protein